MDAFDRIMELSREGLYCAQIMVQLALDAEGKENPELIEAVRGLCGGFAWSGGPCGALSGGACLLAYFAGRGAPGEQPHPKLGEMYASLREWFSEYTAGYGGDTCRCILAGDERNRVMRCPLVVQAVFEKCCGLLEMNGVL